MPTVYLGLLGLIFRRPLTCWMVRLLVLCSAARDRLTLSHFHGWLLEMLLKWHHNQQMNLSMSPGSSSFNPDNVLQSVSSTVLNQSWLVTWPAKTIRQRPIWSICGYLGSVQDFVWHSFSTFVLQSNSKILKHFKQPLVWIIHYIYLIYIQYI